MISMLFNLAALITWAALAVIFNKWWIALFAIFFWTVRRSYIYCDGCGEKGPTANNVHEARAKAHGEGWTSEIREGKTWDYCPKCMKKFNISYFKFSKGEKDEC